MKDIASFCCVELLRSLPLFIGEIKAEYKEKCESECQKIYIEENIRVMLIEGNTRITFAKKNER